MREERGLINGDVVVYEPFTLWGTISGTVKVIDGGKLYIRGTVYGDIHIEDEGRCHIYGTVSGKLVVHRGGKAIHSGVLGGDAVNRGGYLLIEKTSTVMGKVDPHSGKTKIEEKRGA
jgi:cytoskeletal protein CcmA (bactofilin family)